MSNEKPSYSNWLSTVPPSRANDPRYDLEKAYNTLDFDTLERWRTSSDEDLQAGLNHLPSVVPSKEYVGGYDFLKRFDHPSLQHELDWYNGDSDDAKEWRSAFDIDTSNYFYKYVPKSGSVMREADLDSLDPDRFWGDTPIPLSVNKALAAPLRPYASLVSHIPNNNLRIAASLPAMALGAIPIIGLNALALPPYLVGKALGNNLSEDNGLVERVWNHFHPAPPPPSPFPSDVDLDSVYDKMGNFNNTNLYPTSRR